MAIQQFGRIPDGDHPRGGDDRPHHHRPGDGAPQRSLLVVWAQRRLFAGYLLPGELQSLESARRRSPPDSMFHRPDAPAIGTVTVTRHRSLPRLAAEITGIRSVLYPAIMSQSVGLPLG